MIYRGYCSHCDLWALFGVTREQDLVERDYEVHRVISPACEFRAFTDVQPYQKPEIRIVEVRAATPENAQEFDIEVDFAGDDETPFDVN